jgi:dTDP-4-dehydrorhamnose 3,5-epimerase
LKVRRLDISDIKIIVPEIFGDQRGYFFESFNERQFMEQAGIAAHFVQDNVSRSTKNVLRGLHYQIDFPQGKLMRVTQGAIFDVAVDLRKSSPTFGKWVGTTLDGESKHSVWIPPGFAHGFLVLSETAEIFYKVTDYWNPQAERRIAWNDPDLNINWPLAGAPILANADHSAPAFRDADKYD